MAVVPLVSAVLLLCSSKSALAWLGAAAVPARPAHCFLPPSSVESTRRRPWRTAAAVANPNHYDDAKTTGDKRNNTTIISDTSYSRTFPRYRIPMTAVPSVKERASKKLPFFLGDWQRAASRQRLDRTYGSAALQWLDGQDGVAALASLWMAAAAAAAYDKTTATSTIVVAFPDAQPRVVRQSADLLEWVRQRQTKEGDGGGDDEGRLVTTIRAEYFSESDIIPCVKLTRQDAVFATTTTTALHQLPTNQTSSTVVDKRMQSWVKRILVDLKICPFTRSVTRSGQGLGSHGVPVARIAYHTSHGTNVLDLMADTWKAIAEMVDAGPLQVSSILLAAPYFDDKFDLWAGPVFSLLEAGVVAAGAEDSIGVVCFHPKYKTPDGTTFPGFGQMHSVPRLKQWVQETCAAAAKQATRATTSNNKATNDADDYFKNLPLLTTDQVAAGGAWQRRTPHATINVLRADQLQAAEGQRNTPQLYTRNIAKLILDVGLEKLQDDLDRERVMGD